MLAVSDVRPAKDPKHPNHRVPLDETPLRMPVNDESVVNPIEPSDRALEYSETPFVSVTKPATVPRRRKKRKDSEMPSMFKPKNLRRSRRRKERLTRNLPLTAPGYNSVPCVENQKYPLGLEVIKMFHGKPYRGRLTTYSPKERFYGVLYEDGDTEEFDEDDVALYGQFSTASSRSDDRGDPLLYPADRGDTSVSSIPTKDRGETNGTDSSMPLDLDPDGILNSPDSAAAAKVTFANDVILETPRKPALRQTSKTKDLGLFATAAIATLTIPSCPTSTMNMWKGLSVSTHPRFPNQNPVSVDAMLYHDSIGQEYKVNALTSKEIELLQYNQQMDMINNRTDLFTDISDEYYDMIAITEHRIRHKGTDDEEVTLRVQMLDGTSQFFPMDVLRLEHPYLVTEYAVQKNIQGHSAFEWTRDYSDKSSNLDSLICCVKTIGRQPKIKFGVQVPQNVKQAFLLDKLNKDKLWETATLK